METDTPVIIRFLHQQSQERIRRAGRDELSHIYYINALLFSLMIACSCGLDRTAVASSLKLFGPLTRTYSYQWLPQKSAPLLSLPGNPVCPFSTNTSSPGGGGYDLTNPSGLLTFVERLVLVIILGSALFSLAMFFPRIASRDIETMPLLEPSLVRHVNVFKDSIS